VKLKQSLDTSLLGGETGSVHGEGEFHFFTGGERTLSMFYGQEKQAGVEYQEETDAWKGSRGQRDQAGCMLLSLICATTHKGADWHVCLKTNKEKTCFIQPPSREDKANALEYKAAKLGERIKLVCVGAVADNADALQQLQHMQDVWQRKTQS